MRPITPNFSTCLHNNLSTGGLRWLVHVCVLFSLEIVGRGEQTLTQQGTSEVATNLNPGAVGANEQKGTPPHGLFGGAGAGLPQVPVSLRPFQLVLPREHLLDDWFGLRPTAEASGLTPTLTFVTDIAGNVTGGKNQGVTHADNLGFDLSFDLDKLVGLQGGSFLAS